MSALPPKANNQACASSDAAQHIEGPGIFLQLARWMPSRSSTSISPTLKFPANREKNGEFRKIGLLGSILHANTRANSGLAAKFPNQQNKELFPRNREFWRRNRDFAFAKNRNHRRMRFSVHTASNCAVFIF
jgi:hypothetical protein